MTYRLLGNDRYWFATLSTLNPIPSEIITDYKFADGWIDSTNRKTSLLKTLTYVCKE